MVITRTYPVFSATMCICLLFVFSHSHSNVMEFLELESRICRRSGDSPMVDPVCESGFGESCVCWWVLLGFG
ncbi:hypothetical protein KC19_2G195300 [Ceratodon purpureus]|uniref:Secreted protein n=1 Tax=Ceratodon purpureus TaxID=3225 RepID=A0A8T0IYN1_CERPU|nr:hypothetical protein KC19_2G195300 [Ceratodon purpureus]